VELEFEDALKALEELRSGRQARRGAAAEGYYTPESRATTWADGSPWTVPEPSPPP
jgi:hypothetical protein